MEHIMLDATLENEYAESISRVDKEAVDRAIEYVVEETGKFDVPTVRDVLRNQGLIFGSLPELVDFAERQKTRNFIGRIVDKLGKRKYVATKDQLTLDYGREYAYCKAELIQKQSLEEKSSLSRMQTHIVGVIKRNPLLPQWAINEIISTINRVFEKMSNAA